MITFINGNQARIETLHQYQILDTLPEQSFDDLAFLAAGVCHTPIALINFIDNNRQWFRVKVGIDFDEMSTEVGFCLDCMNSEEVLVIPDTLADERYANYSVVTSEPYVRFYAGVPLKAPSGDILGTVCVVDTVPRQMTHQQIESLKSIARLVIRQLEICRNLSEIVSIKKEYEQSQEALRQSECTLRSFFDSAPMMMGVVELRNDNIVHISDNATTRKFFGQIDDIKLVENDNIAKNNHHDWIYYYQAAAETGLPVSFEYQSETLQGKRWLRATVSLINACCSVHGGRFAYVIEDITSRKQAEEKLRWNEELLRSMTSVSPLAFYVVDNNTDEILYSNDLFYEIWGIEHFKEDIENSQLKNQDILPNCLKLVEDIPTFLDSCKPLSSLENRAVVEDEIIFQDGRTIRRFSTQIRDKNDKYFGRLYIFEDITLRKQSEQQVREQAALLDVTTDAIIVRDLNNNILLWNQSAQKLYGWEASEAIGKNCNELLYTKPIRLPHTIYKTVLENGSWSGELRKVSKSGKEIDVESSWTLVRDEHQQPKSILIVDTDVTEKKQLEKQILRAQRMESIGTLASGIAHDLNNVLSPILMSVQVLQAKMQDSRSKQMLSIVESNAKRGANLVKQVLSYARGFEGERYVFQLSHLILEMKQVAEQTFPKSINIITEIQSGLLPVCGDSTQLHQVLLNLCLNARDAMPDGGILTITASHAVIDENYTKMNLEAKAGDYVLLTVSDTGIGISHDILDRIFEPFFTTKEFGKGTGLGLSTVSGIIKGHNGFITVSSNIGKGTKFQVYLPVIQIPEKQPVEVLETPLGNGELILVVDDESPILEISKTTLESHNYQVILAKDGIEAIALYVQQKNNINAAIIDIMMPQMDGNATIQTLRKINPSLKILAVSGLATSEQLPLTTHDAPISFLPKPYTAQELLTALSAIINNNS